MSTENKFTINIVKKRNIDGLIQDAKLDYVNKSVSPENFPLEIHTQGPVVIELISFQENKTTEEALGELDKAGYRPADVRELLTLSAQFPELQRESPIIALGTIWEGDIDRVPVLWGGRGENQRAQFLLWSVYDWIPGFRFAAVKEESS